MLGTFVPLEQRKKQIAFIPIGHLVDVRFPSRKYLYEYIAVKSKKFVEQDEKP